jgi:hypothetical protein
MPAHRHGGHVVILRLIRNCRDDVAQPGAKVGVSEGDQGG